MMDTDNQSTLDQKRKLREQQLLKRFQDVSTGKLDALMSQKVQKTDEVQKIEGANGFDVTGGLGKTDDSKFGDEEQLIIARMAGMGLREGILASIASFVVLRRGPIYIGRWVQRRRQYKQSSTSSLNSSSASYQLSDPKKLTNTTNYNPFERAANARQANFPRPKGFLSRSIWFVFDMALSLMVGTNVSLYYTDKDSIRQQIVGLPLVPGRSLVADTLCDEVVAELRKVRAENDPTFERLQRISRNKTMEQTPASFFMEGIVQFCQNCERRRYLERRIREENGLKRTTPVMIPVPGVPSDGPRLVVGSGETENLVNKDGIEDPFLQQFSQDTQWANDFISDDYESDQN